MRKIFPFAALATMLFIVSVCSGCGQMKLAAIAAESSDQVTLTVYQQGAGLSDDEFKTFFVEPLKKTHPNITLNLVHSNKEKLENLVAAGTVPDLIFGSSRNLTPFLDLNLPMNLYPLLKQYNTNLSQYDPVAIDALRNYGKRGQLYALPVFINFSALYYNKDLFDKFKAPYPRDGMSWNDIIELAKRVTVTVGVKKDKVQYRGLNPDNMRNFASSLSLPAINPATYRAEMLTDGWREVFDTYREIMAIPGNAGGNAKNLFETAQTLAMLPGYMALLNDMETLYRKNKALNFDVVSYPYFKSNVGTGAEIDVQALMITSQSKHKEEAFRVIESVAAPDVQLAATKRGRLSALDDDSMKQEFGLDLKSLTGKNVYGMFKSTPSIGARHTAYDSIANSKINAAANQVVKGVIDVDGALHQLQTDISSAVDEARGIANSSADDADSSDAASGTE